MEKDLELHNHVSQLEELVKARTAALTEAQAQLERAIFEREQAEAEQERLLTAERAQTRRQVALLRLSAELAATLDDVEVCRRVVNGLHSTLGFDTVALFLVDEAAEKGADTNSKGAITTERYLAASASLDADIIPTCIPAGQGLSEYARPSTVHGPRSSMPGFISKLLIPTNCGFSSWITHCSSPTVWMTSGRGSRPSFQAVENG